MIIIAALSENRVIGAGDGMPWDVPEEYQHFRDSVRGATIVMGRKSHDIFGPDLTTDHTIVLTRSDGPLEGDVDRARDFNEALRIARQYGKRIFCGGGASVYEQALPHATEMWLSTIHGQHEGDASFPEFENGAWRVEEEQPHERYTFRRYVRSKS